MNPVKRVNVAITLVELTGVPFSMQKAYNPRATWYTGILLSCKWS